MTDAVSILKTLVSFPCLTESEEPIADWVYDWATDMNLQVGRHDNNVYCWLGEGEQTLLLNSHLDVVPASADHPFEPFDPIEQDGLIYGRGTSDAKASGAAMLATIATLARDGWHPDGGRLMVALTAAEEGSGAYNGFKSLLPNIPTIHDAIIGEPTSLRPCFSQKGLLILRMIAAGRSAHAARPELGENAIVKAARDIQRLSEFAFTRYHEPLGLPTLAVTTVNGGVARNVIPESCEFYVDIRTTPAYTHDEIVTALRAAVESSVEVHSGRYVPCATPVESRVARAVTAALPDAQPFGSPTVSDWAFLKEIPGVKLGPGDSKLSHTGGECVSVDEVYHAVDVYSRIALQYFETS